MIRIIAVDDHTLLREALCETLRAEDDFDVVAQAGGADGIVELVAAHRPDVVLLDMEMPGHAPEETIRTLTRSFPGIKVLVLSMHDDISLIRHMLLTGACGYLHKSIPREHLLSAIRRVVRGEDGLALVLSATGLTRPAATADGLLSARERQILAHVAEALSNRQIATRLGITEGTVKRHLRNVYGKLGAVSRIDAVNRAVAAGLIDAPAGARLGRAAADAPADTQTRALPSPRPHDRHHAHRPGIR
ncbi:DNA-binding response regulator, NarL/FixJ family, contains REC and HTH domains [Thermomonospora echinospora]|uniref:DNA-binding response regulator, NarL/FixJ family, contains REC and HTH domains n=1 Tax=Thermomonospora echinospora TaxID=1992 RepID=A0A1H5VDM6_9ACTN|nr:response regulator transcription factor [Thermomonospora echinospora]SEF85294.1 DNA-binding response regulator, NarL/FixJ family, contains REC and HTH domains [Thermomonospora echinospora]